MIEEIIILIFQILLPKITVLAMIKMKVKYRTDLSQDLKSQVADKMYNQMVRIRKSEILAIREYF